jgi:hypothetical protein
MPGMKPAICNCAECARRNRDHPREGKQLSLIPIKVNRRRATQQEVR